MLPNTLGTLTTKRTTHFLLSTVSYLSMSIYRSWNFSSVSFQQSESRRFCTSRAKFFVSGMYAYGGYPLPKYGGIY